MRICMAATRRGSPHGYTVRRYYKDCIYTGGKLLSPLDAHAFLKDGSAEKVEPLVIDEEKVLRRLA